MGNTELNKTNINFNILKKELDNFPQIMIVCFQEMLKNAGC